MSPQTGMPVRIYEFRKTWKTACRKAGIGHRSESVFERYNIDTDDTSTNGGLGKC